MRQDRYRSPRERGVRRSGRGLRAAAWCGFVLALLPAVAAAGSPSRGEVQVKVRSDGTKLFYNETPTQRARRQSSSLQDPDPELVHWIEFYARRQNLNPRLVQAVVQVESGYNPKALSRKGAMGLMQLMPDTARQLGVTDPYDPVQNLRGGTRYLRQQLERFPNLSLALAAYNAGPTAVARHDGIPPYRETRNYVRKVLGLLDLSRSRPPTADLGQAVAAPANGADGTVPEVAADDSGTEDEATPAPAAAIRGRQVFVHRDENNRISFTTAPPKSR